jgi:hypothetical protein
VRSIRRPDKLGYRKPYDNLGNKDLPTIRIGLRLVGGTSNRLFHVPPIRFTNMNGPQPGSMAF